ncbi:MAG: alpha/beta fold hydrolase [Vicinamibacterales bacterium]|nr:alpha/beta fold hydrolase [Vicinamibacterales bacterium]
MWMRNRCRIAVAFGLGVLLWNLPVTAAAQDCVDAQGTEACLRADDRDPLPLGQRIPLILVHGWNRDGVPGPPQTETWDSWLSFSKDDDALRSRFKPYVFSYYSNVGNVPQLARALQENIDQIGFGGRQIAIVAHSMGGLISRYFLRLPQSNGRPNGERVAILVTLGTPHHGSLAANGPAMASRSGPVWLWLWEYAVSLLYPHAELLRWFQPNRTDLFWDNYDDRLDYVTFPSEQNVLLNAINGDRTYDGRIVAYAGVLRICPVILDDKYCALSELLKALFGLTSDGIVPASSALFFSSPEGEQSRFRTRVFPDYDHTEIAQGKGDGVLFARINAYSGPS